MSHMLFPPSWHHGPPDPPEPCCALAEDDPDHDSVECLADQAEEAAERKAEWLRELEEGP